MTETNTVVVGPFASQAKAQATPTTVADRNSDAQMLRETTAATISIKAAHSTEPRRRSALVGGKPPEAANDAIRRRDRGRERASSVFTVSSTADPTERITDALRRQGEAGEALDREEALTAIYEFEQRQHRADAASRALRVIAHRTCADLTADIQGMEDELLRQIGNQVEGLAHEAEQIAGVLAGIASAEEAIRQGSETVAAWSRRGELRDELTEVARSLHWVRKAVTRGFVPDTTSKPVLAARGDDVTFGSTWHVIDATLDDIGISDAAIEIMTGEK
ncbi:hypothetical protein K8O93_06745 [Gordonia bronchialis]|uniref:hypothetical protein n=1 Tax=Gordonia bronchialis TaxID=2054 RepID=UPI001CBEA7AB|nr:hypothetical protein [Gordonia bronchialis]UAK39372.1 hypothetical protein K8O93_06745 [Gordonia bronchialis]